MNRNRRYKTAIFEQFARIGKALSSPPRHEILDLLCQGTHTVEALANKANLSIANTSRHLQILKTARLVAVEKHGVFAQYQLADERVCNFLLELRGLAESRLAEIEQITRDYLSEKGQFERIGQDEVVGRVRRGDVLLLDVRPTDEYAEGHISGALSVPLGELRDRLKELPRDQEVVAYCRGPYCVLAVEAVSLLRKAGFEASRLEDGVSDWRARGLSITVGNSIQSTE